ncbi:hypothetical protein, partial [Mesorhizobium sp. M7D.F.Ca.US.004.03.1.1]|uniref:hypothetical protein n=1 Tax=Mesorhizobium sp. M7D.F.Ca.US.004.03.1.1 TaxID=2496702 RepID=UPI0019D15B23
IRGRYSLPCPGSIQSSAFGRAPSGSVRFGPPGRSQGVWFEGRLTPAQPDRLYSPAVWARRESRASAVFLSGAETALPVGLSNRMTVPSSVRMHDLSGRPAPR